MSRKRLMMCVSMCTITIQDMKLKNRWYWVIHTRTCSISFSDEKLSHCIIWVIFDETPLPQPLWYRGSLNCGVFQWSFFISCILFQSGMVQCLRISKETRGFCHLSFFIIGHFWPVTVMVFTPWRKFFFSRRTSEIFSGIRFFGVELFRNIRPLKISTIENSKFKISNFKDFKNRPL